MERLRKTHLFSEVEKASDEEEHSLEMQYPYLKLVLNPGTKVIPIMVGSTKGLEKISNELLLDYFKDNESLFVISSDFCHWGSRFQYTFHDPKNEFPYQSIHELDLRGVEAIKTKDWRSAHQNL